MKFQRKILPSTRACILAGAFVFTAQNVTAADDSKPAAPVIVPVAWIEAPQIEYPRTMQRGDFEG